MCHICVSGVHFQGIAGTGIRTREVKADQRGLGMSSLTYVNFGEVRKCKCKQRNVSLVFIVNAALDFTVFIVIVEFMLDCASRVLFDTA